MRKIVASLLATLPLLAAAQEAAQPPAPPQYPPQYVPPPQYTPPPPQGDYAPPPPPQPQPAQYAPPPQYSPPPPQYAPPPQYPPPPQQGQYAPPPQYPPPPPQQPPQPFRKLGQQRDSWYIGFGLGGGGGTVGDAAGSSSFEDFLGKSPTTVSLNFKVGATLTPQLLVGFDISGVGAGVSDGDVTHTLTIVNYDAMATFFPMERGFFVRGGLGLSRFVLDVTGHPISTENGSAEYGGTNVAAGLGYAFWLGENFNLTLNLDWSAQFWGDNDGGTTGPQDSTFWAAGLGFDWY